MTTPRSRRKGVTPATTTTDLPAELLAPNPQPARAALVGTLAARAEGLGDGGPDGSGLAGDADAGVRAAGGADRAAVGRVATAITKDTPFRRIGDLPRAVWVRVLTDAGSPLLAEVDAIIRAASPHGALALPQALKESSLGKTTPAGTFNPLGLLDYEGRTGSVRWVNGLPFLMFAGWAEAFAEFRRRLSDLGYKGGVYGGAETTLEQYVVTYVAGPGCWTSRGATCANGETWRPGGGRDAGSVNLYLAQLLERITGWGATAPAPEVAAPAPGVVETDPYRVICGGAYPAVTYGWLADAGLNYYAYGVNHGTSRATQHTGDDIPLPAGSPLYAPAAGIVDCVGAAGTPRWGQSCGAYADVDGGGVGNITILLDGGVKLTLGHCRQAFVRPGDRVTPGQKVGTVGSMNGPHVHVETSILKNGSYWLMPPKATLAGLLTAAGPAPAPVIGLTVTTAIADGAGSNRPRTPVDGNELWITVHETANTKREATAMMHRTFVNDGGGGDRVSFHFAVDNLGAVQILPLNEIGYHAGDGCDSKPQDTGCFRSVAIETCVNFPADSKEWAQTLDNLTALLALLVTDPGRFVGGAGKRFSFDRIAPHRQWSGKNCPTRMLAGNLLPGIISAARGLAGGYTPAPAWAPLRPITAPWTGDDLTTEAGTFYALRRRFWATRDGVKVHQFASATSPEVRAPLTKGEVIEAEWLVRASDGDWWVVTKTGARVPAAGLHPIVTMEAAA